VLPWRVLTRGALPQRVLPSVFEGFTCGECTPGECSSREYSPQFLKDLPDESTSTLLNFRKITLDEYSLEYSRFLAQSSHLPQQQCPSNPSLILRLLFILFTFYVSHIYTPSLIFLYSYEKGKSVTLQVLSAEEQDFPSSDRTKEVLFPEGKNFQHVIKIP